MACWNHNHHNIWLLFEQAEIVSYRIAKVTEYQMETAEHPLKHSYSYKPYLIARNNSLLQTYQHVWQQTYKLHCFVVAEHTFGKMAENCVIQTASPWSVWVEITTHGTSVLIQQAANNKLWVAG